MKHHHIRIDESRLLDNYEIMMDEVYLLYHTYPTNLTPGNFDGEQQAMDAYGRSQMSTRGDGKKRVRHQDSGYTNGLPRGRSWITGAGSDISLGSGGYNTSVTSVGYLDDQHHWRAARAGDDDAATNLGCAGLLFIIVAAFVGFLVYAAFIY